MSDRLTDAELDAALEHMQSMLSVRGTAIVAELRERRAAEHVANFRDGGEPVKDRHGPTQRSRGAATPGQGASLAAGNVAKPQLGPTAHCAERPPSHLSTAEDNARSALARDPKECVAITAEEACALFDRLADAEAMLEIVRRDFSGPAKPTHHRCQHCLIAAGINERAWLSAEQFTDRGLIEHLLTCHNDPSGVIIGALRDQQLELKRLLSVARAEVADIRRDRDERLAALADANKRLDVLRAAFEAETGKAWSI